MVCIRHLPLAKALPHNSELTPSQASAVSCPSCPPCATASGLQTLLAPSTLPWLSCPLDCSLTLWMERSPDGEAKAVSWGRSWTRWQIWYVDLQSPSLCMVTYTRVGFWDLTLFPDILRCSTSSVLIRTRPSHSTRHSIPIFLRPLRPDSPCSFQCHRVCVTQGWHWQEQILRGYPHSYISRNRFLYGLVRVDWNDRGW